MKTVDGTFYEEATIDDEMSGEYKNITAYYDKSEANGGRIRVLYLSWIKVLYTWKCHPSRVTWYRVSVADSAFAGKNFMLRG